LKLLGTLAGLMLLFLVGLFALWRLSDGGDCKDLVRAEVQSPDGRYLAAIYQHACGGDLVTSHVGLREARTRFEPKNDVVVTGGADALSAQWTGARTLRVQAAGRAKLLLSERAWRDVSVLLGP